MSQKLVSPDDESLGDSPVILFIEDRKDDKMSFSEESSADDPQPTSDQIQTADVRQFTTMKQTICITTVGAIYCILSITLDWKSLLIIGLIFLIATVFECVLSVLWASDDNKKTPPFAVV